jgi:hypothetical protein
MNSTDIYRIIYPTTEEFTFFSAAHGTFAKINYILGHKVSLSKYKKLKNFLVYYQIIMK